MTTGRINQVTTISRQSVHSACALAPFNEDRLGTTSTPQPATRLCCHSTPRPRAQELCYGSLGVYPQTFVWLGCVGLHSCHQALSFDGEHSGESCVTVTPVEAHIC
jgi:hypothetical protein